jgi:predicted transcriptional regulator
MAANKLKLELYQLIDSLNENDLKKVKAIVEDYLSHDTNKLMETQVKYLDDYEASLTDEDRKEIEEAIEEGMEDIKAGRVYDASEVMKEMRQKYGSR